MSGVLARVENARLSLGGRRVLDGLNLALRRGEHTVIFGSNGAGKSTLLRLLRGEAWLDQGPGNGRVWWDAGQGPEDSPLTGRSMAALVSAAQQERYQRHGWNLSGLDLLCTGFTDDDLLYAAPAAVQVREARRTAERLGISALMERGVSACSQGQLRILLLARALLRRPRLLLLDECTDGLDAASRVRIVEALREAAADATLVLTAHRPDAVPDFVRRRLCLREGGLTERLPAQYALDEKPRPAPPPRSGGDSAAPPLVRVRNATVFVERVPVLHDVTWTIRRGEHWMVVGPNGSGKSTLLRLLAGDEYPALGGSIRRFLPRHGGAVDDLESIRRGVRLVSDAAQAVYAYDVTGLELTLTGFDNSMGVYRAATEAEEHEALAWLEALDARPLAGRRIRTLSTGQLRRVLLARALAGAPDILLLDEPFSGLDIAARRTFMGVLENACAKGAHLVLVSHHAGERLPFIRHEARMEQGHLTAYL